MGSRAVGLSPCFFVDYKHLEELQKSCSDTDSGRLGHQLHLVHDTVKTMLPKNSILPVAFATSKCTFSTLQRLKTYLRSRNEGVLSKQLPCPALS